MCHLNPFKWITLPRSKRITNQAFKFSKNEAFRCFPPFCSSFSSSSANIYQADGRPGQEATKPIFQDDFESCAVCLESSGFYWSLHMVRPPERGKPALMETQKPKKKRSLGMRNRRDGFIEAFCGAFQPQTWLSDVCKTWMSCRSKVMLELEA